MLSGHGFWSPDQLRILWICRKWILEGTQDFPKVTQPVSNRTRIKLKSVVRWTSCAYRVHNRCSFCRMGIHSSLPVDVTILPSWRCTTRPFIFIPHICQHGRCQETFVLSTFCFERYNISNFVQRVSSQLENGVSSCHLPLNSEHRWAGRARALDLKEWVHACNISLRWKMRQENHNLPVKTGQISEIPSQKWKNQEEDWSRALA